MPVYSIQGPDGKVYTIEGPAGATKEQVVAAIQAKMAQGTAASPEPVAPPAPPSTERTWAQAGTDLGASLLSGVGNVLQVPGQIAQLLPGLQGFGKTIAKPGEYVEELGQSLKSQGLKVREALRSQAMSEAEKEGILSAFATAISQTIKDPALLSTFITEQLPMLIGPAAAARVAKGVVMSRSALEGAELAAAAGKAGTRAAIGTGALMQGADISSDAYKQALDAAKAQGMTEEQANEAALTAARKAFGISAPISILSQGLLSKVGGTSIERALAGLPGSGRIKGAFGEATQEAIEEGGGAFATNVGVRGVDPTRSLTEGIGSAAGLGTIGGGVLGGVIGGPAPKVERPNAAADQEILALQGETLALQQARDELARAQAQADALEAQKAAAEAAKPKVLDRSGLDALISQPNGYADVMLYREGLRNALEADPGNREVQAAIKIADESLKERGIEDARRKEKAQEALSSKDLASFGINSGTVLYKQLVGKNLADEEQRQQIRNDLTAFKAQEGVKPDQAKKADSVLSYLENYEQTRVPYGRKTAPSGDVAATGGAGAPVAGEPGAGTAAAGSGVAQPSGVVSPEATAGQPAGGEAAAPNTLTAQTLDSIGISPRSVVRKELIGKAVDDPAVAVRLTDLLNNPNIKSKPEVAAKIQSFLEQVKSKAVEQAAAPVEEKPVEGAATEAPAAKQSIRSKAEPAPAVELNGRNIPVELSARDKNAGDVLTTVNTDAFDSAWKSGDKFNNFYIGSGGTGAAIGNRYQQFGNFVNTAKSIEAPTVSVDEDGVVSFGNGRHRFAFMRDQGAKAIPVSMSQESFQNAVKAGYVKSAQKKSLREEAAVEGEQAQPEAAPSIKERLEQVDKEIADRLEKLGKLLQARLSKFGLKDVGVQVIKDLEAGGEYANRLIKLALDVANPIREVRHEAIHALKELGFFTPQQWAALEKQAKDKWIDEYLKNRNVNMEPLAEGQQTRFDAYQQLFTQEAASKGLTGAEAASYIEEATIEEAIADAFGVFDANKAPAGLMQALLERMRKFFNAIKETFGGTATETAEDIFRKIEKGEVAPTISEPSKSEQAFSLRQRNFDNPADRIEVSTAKPSAVNPVPGEFVPRDPIADLYVIDSADIMSIPAHFAAAHNAISGYNWFPVSTNPDANVRAMKDTIVDNLVWLYNLVPAEIRARAKLWYEGANRIANDWAKGYNYTPQQMAGTLAVLSPQKDWFMNVSLAERLISIYTERQNQAWTPAMTAWADSYVKASRSIDTKNNRQEVLDAAKRIEGKKLGELNNEDAAYFIRVFDETYNPRQYRVVTPEGQFGGFVGVNEQVDDEATEEGQEAGHVAWGTFDSIAKGVAILRDGSFNNISDRLGEEHKVRNFYNNIVNPKDSIGSVTIDTHAIAAASMKALSGASLEVLHNFGTTPKAAPGAGASKLTGASGIYGFVADAYREAAAKVSTEDSPVLAREMQSITWEAIRSIFPAAWKRQNASDVEAVYDQFKQGKITLSEARDRVYKMSGGLKGFAWEGQKQGVYASDGATSFDRTAPKDLEKAEGRTLEPYQIREKISVNLSAAGFQIPGIAFLYSRASSGDMAAYTLLQEMANDSVRFLLAGNESVVIKSIPTSGLFDSFYEPSLNLSIAFNEGEREAVLPALRRFSENFQQKQFHVRQRIAMLDPNNLDNAGKYLEREYSDGSYATPVFTFKLAAPLSNQEMADIVNAAGVPGVTFNDNEVITYFVRSKKNEKADGFYDQVQRLAEQIGDIATEVNFSAERLWVYGEGEGVSGRYGSIRGKVRPGDPISSRTAKRVAAYTSNVEEKKLKTFEMREVTAEQDALQTGLGDLYGMLPTNDLDNPLVKRAYEALATELRRQFQALPIRVEWSKKKDEEGRPTDAYGSKSDAMRKDILEYNRLRILPTTPESFGPPGVDFTGHPLLGKTGVMIEGREIVYNDMLRAVHDYYAHGATRATFGRMGEEAAWKNHMAMTADPLARWALTTETRAQNSWVNFRSDLDRKIPADERPFADQKAALVPIDFAMTGDAKVDAPMKKLKAELNKKERLGSAANVKATPKASLRAPQTEAFNQWFGESKIVNPDGTPKVMYHGTARDITAFKPKQAGAIFLTDNPDFAAGFANMSAKWMANHADQFLTPEQLKKGRSDAIKAIRKENKADPEFAKELIDDIDNPQAQYYLDATEYLAKEYRKYLPSGPNIMPLFVRAVRPFDYQNPEHMGKLRNYARTSRYADEKLPNRLRLIEMGRWEEIESPAAQSAIMSLGFDGFYVEEGGVKNLAVYSSNQLKSATGNVGAYGKRPIEKEEAARFGMTAEESAQAQKKGDIRFSLRASDAQIDRAVENGFSAYRANELRAQNALFETLPKNVIQAIQSYWRADAALMEDEGRTRSVSGPLKAASTKAFKRARDLIAEVDPVVLDDPTSLNKYLTNYGKDLADYLDTGRYSLRSQLPASAVAAVDRTTVPRDEKTFVERISSAFSSEGFSWFRAQALNRYNRLSEYDKALAKKLGGTRLLADASAESAALFSDLGAGLTEEVFGARDRIGGIPVYRNGVTVVDNKNGTIKGPLAIFAPLLELSNGDPYIFQTYQFWAGQKRGKRLDAQGKLTPFTAADAVEAQRIERQFPQFKKIQAEWIKFNDGLVDYLVDTGVISRQNAAEFKRYSDYLPFYKQMLGEVTQGPKIFQSIAGVTPPKKYKGSKEGQLDDFLETIIRNVQSSIQSGIKNVASQRAADVATQIGQAFNVTEELNNANTQRAALLNAGVPNTDPRIVQLNQDIYTLRQQLTGATTFVVLKNGMENVYRSSDPLFIDAIKSLNIPDLPFIGLLSAPSNLLRNLVTKDPAFMLANMMRDSMSAWVTSGVKMTPMIDTVRNFAGAIAKKNPAVEALYRSGIIGGYDYASTMEASGRKFGQEIRKETKLLTRGEKLAKPFTSVWEALERGTQASDAATRAEIYKKTLEATKSAKYPNGNEAEALFRALEVMNFNRKGRSAVVRILTAAVPFLNARMQGLDVLYRTAIQPFFDKNATNEAKAIQKTFFVRGMTIMALSAMYWALTHDDDDYKKQEQETRDNFWLIPSMGVKIPIPFEIGVMFKVIPERIMAYTFGTDTGKDFMESMKRQFQSTFLFTGIPQAALPIYEVKTNHSFFTQRPIIGQGMENVADKYQIGPTTSRISQMIGEELNLSPIQLDHLIKGYTGTLGMYAVDLFDAIYDMNSDAPKAAKRFEQMPIIKRFAVDPQARGAVSAYYQLKNSVDEVVRTTNFLERSMRFDEYAEYLNENANVLAVKDYISDMEKSMKEIREARALVSSSQMSAIDKRESLKSLTDVENALNANIQQVKMIAYKKGG